MKSSNYLICLILLAVFSLNAQDGQPQKSDASTIKIVRILRSGVTYDQRFFPSGKIYSEVPLLDGKINGLLTAWNEDGSIRYFSMCYQGHILGIITVNRQGRITSSKSYDINSNKNGFSFYFNDQGALTQIEDYKQNVQQENTKYFDEFGHKISSPK